MAIKTYRGKDGHSYAKPSPKAMTNAEITALANTLKKINGTDRTTPAHSNGDRNVTTKLSAQDIQNQINHLVADIDRNVRGYKAGNRHLDFTPEGQKKQWDQLNKKQRDRLNQISELPGKYAEAATNNARSIRAAHMPTSDDPQAQIAAEMAYQRIMSRPSVKSADSKFAAARSEIMALGPSPARTLILNEMADRGDVPDSFIDGLVCEESPEYKDALWQEQMAVQHAATLNRKIANVTSALDSRPGNETHIRSFELTGMAEVNVDAKLQSLADPLHEIAYDIGEYVPLVDGPTVPDFN